MVSPKKIAGTSDEAVKKATGKSWSQWLALLDRKKATQLSHREIGQFLREKHKLSQWWAQKVSVGYEQERGMRVMHEQPEGFEISKSKTLSISPMKAFEAWDDKKARDKWLSESIIIRKATPAKSIRMTWPDKTNVDVNFYDKGKDKCQVSVYHTRLSNAVQAEKMKKYWAAKLDAFRDYLKL